MADVNWTTSLVVDDVTLATSVETEIIEFNAPMEIGIGLPDYYTGATTIIPSVVEQVLETAEKIVRDNIIVEEIPYMQVSNPAGGYTVTIG